MAVYVDDVRHQFGNMIMSHLWADTLEELLDMVDLIQVNRKWIQGHPTLSFGKHRDASWVHFDIALSKKQIALQHGAILTDKYGPIIHTATLDIREGWREWDLLLVMAGYRRLRVVQDIREKRGTEDMPQASEELRDMMRERFGTIDSHGPEKYLKDRGYLLSKNWLWKHPLKPTYDDMTREEFECLLFLIHEWDYGGLVPR